MPSVNPDEDRRGLEEDGPLESEDTFTRRAEEIKAYRLERNKTVLFAVNKMIEIIYMTMWTAPRNL